MPICRQCNEKFPNRLIINGKWRNLHTRQFCINCSPFLAHNTKSILLDNTQTGTKICTQCNTEKSKSEFYTSNNKIHGSKCKQCFNTLCINRQQNIKKKIVEYLGGECIVCSYNETLGALSCHHVNPEEKDIDMARLTTRAWKNIIPELNKCVLLCVRCHIELHSSHLAEHHKLIVNEHYERQKMERVRLELTTPSLKGRCC